MRPVNVASGGGKGVAHLVKFRSAFLLPIGLIVGSAVAALFAGLFVLTRIQDDMESVRERNMAATVVAARVDYMRRLMIEYAQWDEAARRLVLAFDEDWADREVGSLMYEQNGFEAVFVTDDAGRPLYGIVDGRRSRADPRAILGSGYARAFAVAVRSPAGPLGSISASRIGPVLFGINQIAPTSESLAMPAHRRRYLVFANRIDAGIVAELRDAMQGPSMTLQSGLARGPGTTPLRAYDGAIAGSLSWTPETPGTTLRDRLLPWLALLTLAMIGLAAAVLRRALFDARQLQASEVKALHLANHDALTGLPNRRAFVEHLLRLTRAGDDYAILYMDLDGFKEVNDTYGHGTGDALLRSTGARLGRVRPQDAFLARLGGDEFALAVPGPLAPDALAALAEDVLVAVRGPERRASDGIAIGASIGIALREGAEYEDVVRRADIAMYAAKARGRDCWCLFEPMLDDGRRERKAIEADLREAIEAGSINVAFQPIVRADDRAVVSVEALARWNHPTLGPIAPDIFIPVAEESGLIIPLGKQILRQACMAARNWPYELSVNLSPAQFWDRELVAGMVAILDECGFPADRLELEITETYLLRRPDAAAEVIAKLRRLGIRIALDDFGTGYASIGYLRRFNLDRVKLDRSFVEGIAKGGQAADVALAVIALSNALHLPVVAEGVETEAAARLLTAAGCAFLQGWRFGRPLPAREVDAGLASEGRARVTA